MPCRTSWGRVLAAVTLTVLSACSGDVNPVRDAVVATGIASGPKEGQDFVRATRRAGIDYMPVGVSAPDRTIRKKTPEEVKALEAELDAARSGNEARAAQARQQAAPGEPTPRR